MMIAFDDDKERDLELATLTAALLECNCSETRALVDSMNRMTAEIEAMVAAMKMERAA